MMKQILLAAGLIALVAPQSVAQNNSQIATAKSGKSCKGCNLFQADLAYRQITKVSFEGARLRQADLTLATMDGVNFSSANLSIANMYGARFSGASFKNADLTNAILVGGSFEGANFSGTKLTNANISGAEMSTVRGLTQGQLNSACGDASTRLPSGLNVQHCR